MMIDAGAGAVKQARSAHLGRESQRQTVLLDGLEHDILVGAEVLGHASQRRPPLLHCFEREELVARHWCLHRVLPA